MSNPFSLEGQTALVTGASSGLGRHFALTLAKAGARVAVCARRTDRLKELVEEIEAFDGRAMAFSMDVTDHDSIVSAIDGAETELGATRVLVNNAGTTVTKKIVDFTVEDYDHVMDTNLRGAWLVRAGGWKKDDRTRTRRFHRQYRVHGGHSHRPLVERLRHVRSPAWCI